MNFLLISAIHTQLSLKIYSSKTYNRILFLCTIPSNIYKEELDSFILFLTPQIIRRVYILHYHRAPFGRHYSTTFMEVLKFFNDICWLNSGFYISHTITKVYIKEVGFVFVLKPRFMFSFIFLILRYYLRSHLKVGTLYGKKLEEVKEGHYYILHGDILVSPLSLRKWQNSSLEEIQKKRFPLFLIDLMFKFFVLDSNFMSDSKSIINCLSYDGKLHRWRLSKEDLS